MSSTPSGFRSKEEYNTYMRDYKAKRRDESLKHEVDLLLAHAKLSKEDSQQVQSLVSQEKYFEARNLILFALNQLREKNDFAINQEKQNLINKYLRSDPEYEKMSPEGQRLWDLILAKEIDLLATIISQGQFLIYDTDFEHYKKLKINSHEDQAKLEQQLMNDLLKFFEEKMNAKTSNLRHAPKFNIPKITIVGNRAEESSRE
jgi:hypothetical protein